MNQTGFIFHKDFLKHNPGFMHPENSCRLKNIITNLTQTNLLSKLTLIEPRYPCPDWIMQIHSPDYISHVKDSVTNGVKHLDPDTGICLDSYHCALLAVGGILEAIDAVMTGQVKNAFCAVRPPGHHSERDRARGFCIFNNIAIGAVYLRKQYRLNKICIIDWDVHHGNGTQYAFYEDPSVFYFSVHQYPYFPGSGRREEKGVGAGVGTTMNIPLSAGHGDSDYIDIFENILIPELIRFNPEFVLISAGFDGHYDDPIAGMELSTDGYAKLTELVTNFASNNCDGRIVSVLEGGYSPVALPLSVQVHLEGLLS